MIIEDARELTRQALETLASHKIGLDLPHLETCTLPEFLKSAQNHKLTRLQKETIVDQAILMVDQLYAHLPFKRARYAIDPVQRLRLLRVQLHQMRDLEFHAELLNTFLELRDAHTFYGLPEPYQGAVAFLPFTLESYHEKGKNHFIVTHVMEGFDHPYFKSQAEIEYWNGMPVSRAVERIGDRVPGGNRASRFARGLRSMTVLPLTYTLPPDELWVTLQYKFENGEERGITLPWSVGTGFGHRVYREEATSSICAPMAEKANARKVLWTRHELTDLKTVNANGADLTQLSTLPNLLEFQYSGGSCLPQGVNPDFLADAEHPAKSFGYIRIKSFEHDSDEFFEEFLRILKLMKIAAPDGLILDVRGNPGGNVQAAERILQLLTPGTITPAAFHFINTALTQHIAEKLQELMPTRAIEARAELQPWVRDILDSVAGGSVLTEGKPLTDPDLANGFGQQYQGPVTLLIDAIAYSATDVFAAGFQDHAIGTIIGVDENTGGGGANRWLHDELVTKLNMVPGLPLASLPGGAAFGVAIRRCLRSGTNAGSALEDVGVRRDIEYQITRRDLNEHSRDLLAFACAQLGGKTAYELEVLSATVTAEAVNVTVKTANLERLECWLNDHPQCALLPNAQGGEQSFSVPLQSLAGGIPKSLGMRGFNHNGQDSLQFVASARFALAAGSVATPAS